MLDVVVLEVDKDRGRIALKLGNKHEDDGLVSPEALMERVKAAGSSQESSGGDSDRGEHSGGGGEDGRKRRRRSGSGGGDRS